MSNGAGPFVPPAAIYLDHLVALPCRFAQATGAAIEADGFSIGRCERFSLSASALERSVPHILGTARRS